MLLCPLESILWSWGHAKLGWWRLIGLGPITFRPSEQQVMVHWKIQHVLIKSDSTRTKITRGQWKTTIELNLRKTIVSVRNPAQVNYPLSTTVDHHVGNRFWWRWPPETKSEHTVRTVSAPFPLIRNQFHLIQSLKSKPNQSFQEH